MDADALCPCCGDYGFKERGKLEICPLCGWADDPPQREEPGRGGGANKLSLDASRARWEARKSIAAANLYRST